MNPFSREHDPQQRDQQLPGPKARVCLVSLKAHVDASVAGAEQGKQEREDFTCWAASGRSPLGQEKGLGLLDFQG